VLYALEGVAGLRHGEAAALRWFHYDAEVKPLGKLMVARSNGRRRTKTGMTRMMPVHPAPAEILATWRTSGWPAIMGREPSPDDLVILCPKRRCFEAGRMRDKNYSRKRLIEDFAMLGFRHRRGHDLRRTMISLARMDGAGKDLLEVCTHRPTGGRTAIDLYTTFDWEALCAEVAKLRIALVARRSPDETASAEPVQTAP
jgi:integrase